MAATKVCKSFSRNFVVATDTDPYPDLRRLRVRRHAQWLFWDYGRHDLQLIPGEIVPEAICIVLDVGPSMGQAAAGAESFLETAIEAITMIVQRKVFAESKDEVALVLFGTPDTNNPLDDDLCYQNVSIVRPLSIPDFDLLDMVKNIRPSDTSADFIDALVVGLDHIAKGIVGKRGFASKRLILFSDLGGEFGDDQIDVICDGITGSETHLNVIGPDIDSDGGGGGDGPSTSSGGGGHVKQKSPQQVAGEAMMGRMLERVGGESYSFGEALPALSYFQARQTRPTPWKCTLDLGASLRIPIAGYIKVKDFKLKQSWKKVSARDPTTPLTTTRMHVMNNDIETLVERDEVVDGHRYGNTIVPMTDDDKENMKYRAEKCFKILGFTKAHNVKRHQYMGDSVMSVGAEKDDQAAAVALSALINALYETNMVAIVRRVYSASASPRVGVLTPNIKAQFETLLYTELPFREDVRQFTFGSLPVDPKSSTNSKYAPSEEQLTAVDDLITSMDISSLPQDDEKIEALKPKTTFNPYFQKLYQCLQQRATNPDAPLPDLSPLIAQYLTPPREVAACRLEHGDELKRHFKLEVVDAKKEEKTGEQIFAPNDTADASTSKRPRMDNDLGGGIDGMLKVKVTEVGTVTPVEDFDTLVEGASDDAFKTACAQLENRLSQIVMDSFGSQFYEKALDCLKALRSHCCKSHKASTYNTFIQDFKPTLIAKGRRDFWERIILEKLGLITSSETHSSSVTDQEGVQFMSDVTPTPDQMEPTQEDDDEEDLLAGL